jgi:hypothetical protein
MGSDVKVMGPATLAKQVKDALQKMFKQYWAQLSATQLLIGQLIGVRSWLICTANLLCSDPN